MGRKWPIVPLDELVDAQRGISYGIVQPGQPVPDGVPIIRVTDIRDGRVNSANPLRVAPDIAAKYRRTTLRGGELLLTLVGTVGETAVAPAELAGWNTARAVAVIPVLPDPGPQWIRYALQTGESREYIDTRLNTTVQATLNLGDVSTLPIPMPDRGTRKRILDILGTLDDKIELNRRTNETLEAMARALFKSWFVDFDPVRAKAKGRQPSGMDAETAKLFPSEFEESELGEIPKGWVYKSLAEAAELNPTRVLKKDADAPYVEMASLPTRGHRPAQWPLRKVGSGARFRNGDTLLARITPCLENGKTGYVDFLDDGVVGWGSTEYIVIHPRPPLPPEWGYLVARDGTFRDFAAQEMEGTTGRQRVSADSVGRYMVAMPSADVASRFGLLVAPLFQRMASADDENRVLAATRDALLPRLLSGELSVAGAERVLEAQT